MQLKMRHLMLLWGLLFALVNPVQGASFTTLEPHYCGEPGVYCGPVLVDVSADGAVVVGNYHNYHFDASPFIWSQSSGEEEPEPFIDGWASCILKDGSVMYGATYYRGFKWTRDNGTEYIEDLPEVLDTSADGSVVVGTGSGEDDRPILWTEDGGMVVLGQSSGAARAVSNDGTVVAGYSYGDQQAQAFRWTESEGMTGLGYLSGASDSSANGISGDGSIIVGESGNQAFRWTESEGMTGLGYLTGASDSVAYGISGDGSIIVGESGNQAFIWDATNGMQNLKDVLANTYGLDVPSWDLDEARSISADGKTIIGNTTIPDYEYEDEDGEVYEIVKSIGWIASITPDQSCEFTPGPDACSDPNCPCEEGQGDCDSDAECAPGLYCAQDVGADYGWPASRDVCEACPEFVAGPDACTSSCPCGEGEGDCDSDTDCEAGLTCVQDVGANYGWPASRDVCEACPEFVAGPDACTSSCPCGEGEGDCDSDADCEAGLTCVQNVGADYGWPASRDVCQ